MSRWIRADEKVSPDSPAAFRLVTFVLRSPALRAAQTAEGLALEARAEPLLRDCDFGCWAGRSLAEVQAQAPEAVADWLANPHAAPHGGESFADG
jgi:broad specificity phosphatase PhoE